MPDDIAFETLCAHAGDGAPGSTTSVAPELHLASVFETPSLDLADDAISGRPDAYIYSRDANPTVVAVEQAVAALDGAEAAVATASGMAATSAVFLALLSSGDGVLVARELYGATVALLSGPLAKFGIESQSADVADVASFEGAMRQNTRIVFVETISNPLMRIADIPALAEVAHRHGALLVVDASFTSPVLSRPLDQDADLVVHSATKYLGGHSDVMAGVVTGGASLISDIRATRKLFGPVCAPLDAWLTLRGIKTLPLRMAAHSANATGAAAYLSHHEKVRAVFHAGLPDETQHALAIRLYPRGTGGMLSFEIDGGRAAVDRFLGALSMIRFAASFADVTTTVSHPGITSHRGFTAAERGTLGISDGLIRLSAGLEALADICADLERGLAAI